jgi:hypothetical protein
MSEIALDEHGFPVLLADVPGAGVSRAAAGTRSGNPRHDVRSGKFGAGGAPPDPKSALPNADPVEVNRMMDAVRDAAREFDMPQEGDIREFLAGRAKNPAQVDVKGFLAMVREQIKTDLVDIFDQQMRTGEQARGRRVVKLSAPKGYLMKTMRSLSSDEVGEIMHRLEARGLDADAVEKRFKRDLKEDHHAASVDTKNALAASDSYEPTGQFFDYIDEPVETEDELHFAADMAERIAKNIQPPIVNVTVEPPPPRRMEVVRDPETKLLIGTREVEDGG